jgi:hypothetical protein
MTHEALIQTSETTELQQLRELVRHIAAEDEPSQLQALFAQLRTLVGLSQDDADLSSTPDLTGSSLAQPAEE